MAWHDAVMICPKCDCMHTREMAAEECVCPDCSEADLIERVAAQNKVFRDLLEAAEEMYEYCDSWHWKYGEAWKAAIDAARRKLE